MSALVTGEAVELELSPARVLSRSLAFGIDATLQIILLVGLVIAASAIVDALGSDDAIAATLALLATLIALVGYPVVNEVVSRGRSLGKAALGLRVVRTDGGPERFRHALTRALFGVVEIWLTLGTIAFIASITSKDGKRVGDQFAGTIVVRERTPVRVSPVWAPPPWLVPWVTSADLSSVPDDLAASARQLIVRANELDPEVRRRMGQELATAMATHVSPPAPPGTTAEDYLAAVLAERRRREEWRLATVARTGTQPATPTITAAPPGTPVPTTRPQPAVPQRPDAGTEPGTAKPPARSRGLRTSVMTGRGPGRGGMDQ